jgi:hypothetical protein
MRMQYEGGGKKLVQVMEEARFVEERNTCVLGSDLHSRKYLHRWRLETTFV